MSGTTLFSLRQRRSEFLKLACHAHVSLTRGFETKNEPFSPTAMFGLASLPLTQRFLHKLDVVQRRMLRSIVGWVRIPDEPWENTMRRVNQRMEHAAYLHPLRCGAVNILKANTAWQPRLFPINFSWLLQPLLGCLWMIGVHNLPSAPSRSRGRPPKRWDQATRFVFMYIFWRAKLVGGSPKF